MRDDWNDLWLGLADDLSPQLAELAEIHCCGLLGVLLLAFVDPVVGSETPHQLVIEAR
jgi:hypothetical protein